MARDTGQKISEHLVSITIGPVTLKGSLVIPAEAQGIVLFAHGSGSSRHSPRNRFVAEELQKTGLATLLFDLLTHEEEQVDMFTRELRFDTELLASRLVGATQWIKTHTETKNLRIGYFGASTGAAAALIAATRIPEDIDAVVSRGGRPDLAGAALSKVKTPTLLIVGGVDYPVIDMNETALKRIPATKKLVIVPGASHLFEEPGTLEAVARQAADWFTQYLVKTPVSH